MSQVNLINRPQNLHVEGKSNARPRKINRVEATNNYINSRQIKESVTKNGRCPTGQRWHKKLMMCIPEENIKLLQDSARGYVPPSENRREARKTGRLTSDSRELLREALRRYDEQRHKNKEEYSPPKVGSQ